MALLRRRDEKIEALRRVPMFRDLARKELNEVARHAEEVTVAEGTAIVRQDEPGDACYLIVSGAAVVRRNGRKIAEMGDGDVIGEMAILENLPRSATVVATADTVLLEMSRRDFRFVIEQFPGVSRKLLATLADRLREADKKLVT